jgi:hypothetical protein
MSKMSRMMAYLLRLWRIHWCYHDWQITNDYRDQPYGVEEKLSCPHCGATRWQLYR